MASYHYGMPHYQTAASTHSNHSHGHHGRSRRGPRVNSQNAHRQYKAQRSPKEELPQPPTATDYLRLLEAAKGFEFDDDEVFCPFNLLTEDDLQSIHSSSGSDRGSLSSGSPESSPLQQQAQPTPSLLLSSAHNTYNTAGYQQHMKLHQPMAQRTRNAIPIVDPSTRSVSVASPPMSVSPGRQMQQQYLSRRW